MPGLIPGYSYRHMDAEETASHLSTHRSTVFVGTFHLSAHYVHSEAEQQRLVSLAEHVSERYKLRLGIFQDDAFVGWHVGSQIEVGKFYMTNTGILRDHQRRGLYTALLPIILETVKKEGFQVVYSRHNLTNNAVIVPKLRAGFVISGFDVSDRFGTRVKLSYFFNPLRRKMLDVRVGQSTPDDGVKKLLF